MLTLKFGLRYQSFNIKKRKNSRKKPKLEPLTNDVVLENKYVKALFSRKTGLLTSIKMKNTGEEQQGNILGILFSWGSIPAKPQNPLHLTFCSFRRVWKI